MLAAADNAAIRTAIGLGSVNNTADTAKPVSTAQQTALDLKANLASPTLTTPTIAGATMTATIKHTHTHTADAAGKLLSKERKHAAAHGSAAGRLQVIEK